jgi:hypothetical protein
MASAYFLGMVVGVPLALAVLAILAGYLFGDSDAEVLDWRPTRSPEREAELQLSELDQLRASLKALRQRHSALPARENRRTSAAHRRAATTVPSSAPASTSDG